jgi:cell wall-associated NlpC family hydrolase
MNLPVAIVVTGAGVVLAWAGLANPEGGLTAEIGRVLRGEQTATASMGGLSGKGAANSAATRASFDTSGRQSAGAGGGIQQAGAGATGVRARVVAEAKTHLGKPYLWGGKGPDRFDCSGFVEYVMRAAAGLNIPAPSELQCLRGSGVSEANAQPGDLVCYGTPAYHIGIYLGGGQFIHAPRSGDVVKIESVNWAGHYYRNVLGGNSGGYV